MAVSRAGISSPSASALAISALSLVSGGKNSCRGGSRRRIVTGKPDIAIMMPTKSARCSGSISAITPRCTSSFSANTRRSTKTRRGPRNICSVRQSPTPSAPRIRALTASSGVSAFVWTLRVRISST